MADLPEITPAEINEWLVDKGYSRDWLAEQVGTHPGTVANWLAPNGGRVIPVPTLKLIERLMCDDLLDEPQYSYAEARIIRQAMKQENYTSFRDFQRDAILANARDLLDADTIEGTPKVVPMPARATAREDLQRVAEDPAPYGKSTLQFYGLVAAGNPGGPIDVAEDDITVPGMYDPATHFALRVNGESMAPTYPDKSIIICRRLKDGEFATKGDDVVAADSSGAYFKRLVYLKTGPKGDTPRKPTAHLMSLNPDYAEVIPASDMPIQAVVVATLPNGQ